MTENSLGKFYELKKEELNDASLKWVKTINLPEKNGIEIFVHKRPMEGSILDITKSDVIMIGINVGSMKKFAKANEK